MCVGVCVMCVNMNYNVGVKCEYDSLSNALLIGIITAQLLMVTFNFHPPGYGHRLGADITHVHTYMHVNV